MTDITLDIIPQRSALLEGHATEIHTLVRVRAPRNPDTAEHQRPPLNLALVLDRSGSMRGQPIAEAKRCAYYIVDKLTAQDRLALVAYDDTIDLVVPSQPVTDKDRIKSAISEIHSRGLTDLHGGWLRGATENMHADVGKEFISRVLLLSDGQANQGVTAAAEIARDCSDMAEQGVSTSTYGLGQSFNEDLMVQMAEAGGGQSYYGETAEDLMDPFQEEFSLLANTCARQLQLALQVPEGVSLEVMNDYRRLEDGRWQLRDLAYEGEVWALVKLVVPAHIEPEQAGNALKVLNATLQFVENEAEAPTELNATLWLPRVPAAAWNAIVEAETVVARIQEIRVAQLQRQVREAAMREDWIGVDNCMGMALVEAKDNAWVKESLASLRGYAKQRDSARMAKEARYSSDKLTKRMASQDEEVTQYNQSDEYLKPAYLRKKREQGRRIDHDD
jgi:Ca-activated chloride channel family protein